MASAVAGRLSAIRRRSSLKDREVALLIDATPTTVSRWQTGKTEPQPDKLQRLLTLEWLVEQLGQLYPDPAEARLWLFSRHKALGGATPAERIQEGKVDDVLAVIAQIEDGAYV